MRLPEPLYDPHTQLVFRNLHTYAQSTTSDTVSVDADFWHWVTDPLLQHTKGWESPCPSAVFYESQHEAAEDLAQEYSAVERLFYLVAPHVVAVAESGRTDLDMAKLIPLAQFFKQDTWDRPPDPETLRVDETGRLDAMDYVRICEHDLSVLHPDSEDLERADRLRRVAAALPSSAMRYDISVQLVTDVIVPLVQAANDPDPDYGASRDVDFMDEAYEDDLGIEDLLTLMRQAALLLGPLVGDDTRAHMYGVDPAVLTAWYTLVTQARTPRERYLAEHNMEDPEFEDGSC